MTEAAKLKKEIDNVAALIDTARHVLADGRLVDLKGLDRRVETACTALAALAREDAQALQPRMIGLLEGIDSLARDLRARHAELKSALGGLSSRARAATAYVQGGGAARPK